MEKCQEPILAANSSSLACNGKISLLVTYGNKTVTVNALVSSSLKRDILLSCYDVCQLNIISKDFPKQLETTYHTVSDEKAEFENDSDDKIDSEKDFQKRVDDMLDQYSDVFSDSL